jgi:hypothetical protein
LGLLSRFRKKKSKVEEAKSVDKQVTSTEEEEIDDTILEMAEKAHASFLDWVDTQRGIHWIKRGGTYLYRSAEGFLCDSCAFNWHSSCHNSKRPNVKECPDYKSKYR